MKIKERDYLIELQKILSKVPFPHSGMGMKTASTSGFVAYSEDMGGLIPMIKQVLNGIVFIDNIRRYPDLADEYEEGWDYHDPGLTIQAIQEWLKFRVSQKWENPDRYELKKIYERVRREAGLE